jgi:hypothetical protein
MKLTIAFFLMALPLAAVAQSNITIEGNGAGAAGATLVLPPDDGIVYVCTNVTSCSTSIAAPTGSSGGAQVSHTTATPTGDINSICINSPLCSTILGQ